MNKIKKNGEIEFLRILFALTIMFRHGNVFTPEKLGKLFSRGSLAVDFFLILSGYLMAAHCARYDTPPAALGTDTIGFVKKKFFGLMPEFLFAWIFSFLISNFKSGVPSIQSLGESLISWIWEIIPLSMAGFTQGSFHMAAWYISAMLLAMLILYPLCRRYHDVFMKIIAPLLAIFIYGIFELVYQSPLGPREVIGEIVFKGMIRAIAGISLGCVSYSFAEVIRKKATGKGQKTALTLGLTACLLVVFGWMIFGKKTLLDTFCVLLFCVICSIVFSRQTLFAEKFDRKFFYFLGRMSMLLYLCHAEIAKAISVIYRRLVKAGAAGIHPRREFVLLNLIYIAAVIALMAVVFFLSEAIRKHRAKKA